jgi:hypothetical protein
LFILFITQPHECPFAQCTTASDVIMSLTLGSLEEFNGFLMRFTFNTLQQIAITNKSSRLRVAITLPDCHEEIQLSVSKQIWKLVGLRYNFDLTHHTVDRHELITAFQIALAICHSARNNSRYVNWRVLFFTAHDVETQTFSSLWQFNDSRVRMTFACRKRSNCSLQQ